MRYRVLAFGNGPILFRHAELDSASRAAISDLQPWILNQVQDDEFCKTTVTARAKTIYISRIGDITH